MALPLLPEDEIHKVYISLELPTSKLEDSAKELIKKFRIYLNRTWISGNVSHSVFYYENATNNGPESHHKSLKSYIKIPHPKVWKFMAYLNTSSQIMTLNLSDCWKIKKQLEKRVFVQRPKEQNAMNVNKIPKWYL